MPSQSRIGNTVFFIGLILLTLAAIVLSMSDGEAILIAGLIGGASLLLMVIGGWLWAKPDHNPSTSITQQSPRLKLLSAIPALVLLLLPADPEDRIRQFLGYALLAVALVGALELVFDRKFPSAKGDWDRLAAWKKLGISTVVVVAAFFIFVSIAMLVARRI